MGDIELEKITKELQFDDSALSWSGENILEVIRRYLIIAPISDSERLELVDRLPFPRCPKHPKLPLTRLSTHELRTKYTHIYRDGFGCDGECGRMLIQSQDQVYHCLPCAGLNAGHDVCETCYKKEKRDAKHWADKVVASRWFKRLLPDPALWRKPWLWSRVAQGGALSLGVLVAAAIFCLMAGAGSPAPVAADAVGSSLGTTFSLGMVLGVVLGASYCAYISRESIKNFLYPKFGWSTQSESSETQSESSEIRSEPSEAQSESSEVHTEATAKTNTTDPPKTAEDEEFSILVVISVVVGVMVVILVALYFFFAKTKSDEEDVDELPDLENPPIRRDSLQQEPRRHEEIVARLEGTSMPPPELAKHPLSRFKRMRQRID